MMMLDKAGCPVKGTLSFSYKGFVITISTIDPAPEVCVFNSAGRLLQTFSNIQQMIQYVATI